MDEQQEVAPVVEATAEDVAEQVTEPTEATEEGQAEQPADDSEDQQRKGRHQRRKEAMERMRKEADAERERAEALQARLNEYEAAAGDAKQPQESDYKSYEEYTAALAGWHAVRQLDAREKARTERELEQHRQRMQQAQQAQQQEIAQNWASQVAEAKGRYADFDAVVSNPNLPISQGVADIIRSMDEGADVAYHLGTNPALAQQISQLPPIYAAMELGKVAASLSAPKPRTVTKAPDPVAPVRARASAGKDPAKMTADEYDAWRSSGGTF